MTVATHGADFDGELFTAIAARPELPVIERRGFEAAAVRTAPMNTILAPTLRFKKSKTSGFVGELLLEGE